MKGLFNRAVGVLEFPWFVTVESSSLGQFWRIKFLTSNEIQDQILKSLLDYKSKTMYHHFHYERNHHIFVFLCNYCTRANITCSWLETTLQYMRPKVTVRTWMNLKKCVKSTQTAGYTGTCTVNATSYCAYQRFNIF